MPAVVTSCPPWLQRLTGLALAGLAATLAWRHIESHDVGYHLAYGERLLHDLAPVDDQTGVYPTLDLAGGTRPEPGPGCWYDEAGRYRFPNANWLSQAVTWLAFALGGDVGLSVLCAAVFVALTLVQFAGMQRAGLSLAAAAAATLPLVLLLCWRVEPRPELFGYLVLSLQLTALLATAGRGRLPGRGVCIGLVLLQVLLVNLHSYFLLGIAAAAAFWLHALLRPADLAPGAPRRLGLLVGALVVACGANPWTWRLAILPVQTLLYLRAHHVTDAAHSPPHPWSAIDEFRPLPLPWQTAAWDLPLVLFHLLLAAAAIGLVTALRRRRFDHAALVALGALTALTMRRNVPPAALLLVPTLAAALAPAAAAVAGRRLSTCRRVLPGAVAATALLLAALSATGTVARWTGSRAQFGAGFSPLYLPVGVAGWLDTHAPRGRLWTDFNASSNLHFLARARPEVPLLTNTWAMPPATMRLVLDRLAGAPFPEAAAWGIEVVALETDSTAAPMVRRLARDPGWILVHVEPRYAVFLRADGANAALAARQRAREADFDLAAWRRPWARWPALDQRALRASVHTFGLLGWHGAQIAAGEALLAETPADAFQWSELGAACARRGLDRVRGGDRAGGRADLLRAEQALQAALARRPDMAAARQNLAAVQRALTTLGGG